MALLPNLFANLARPSTTPQRTMVATLAAAVAGLALLAGASPPGAHAARPAPRLQGLGAEVTASDLDLVKKLDDQFAQAYNGGACWCSALRREASAPSAKARLCPSTPLPPFLLELLQERSTSAPVLQFRCPALLLHPWHCCPQQQ